MGSPDTAATRRPFAWMPLGTRTLLSGRARQTSQETLAAFADMWSLQTTKGNSRGSCPWLQLDLEPWESAEASHGATLAAAALGSAPANTRSDAAAQNGLKLLREYLSREYGSQPTMNRVALLWAATKLPWLVEPAAESRHHRGF